MDSGTFVFRTAAARAPLDRFVEAIWSVRGAAPYRRAAVLPNGALQLMLGFGAPHRLMALGGRDCDAEYREAWIAGLQEQSLSIEAPEHTHVFAIRFRPGGAHAFLPLPVSELTNQVTQGIDVLGTTTAELRERVALAPDWAAQVRAAEDWLLARCRPRERDHALVTRAIAALGDREGGESVAGTCERLGLSNRHLIHLFRGLVGLPPKTLVRVQRFHAALARLPNAGHRRAALALELGYADQAHFNNEFRRFSGVTPGAYLEHRALDNESVVLD